MCGIAGFLDATHTIAAPEQALRAMADRLEHRGPDDAGTWWQGDAGVGFAFRRLAIQDCSPLGHQPMTSPSGRYTIAFNGEIYNFRALRETCQGVHFRGGSDTEVLLALIERVGLRSAIDACVGMFAFALWDNVERELTLVRDRIGVKPLYVGFTGSGDADLTGTLGSRTLVFASELKAMRAIPSMHFDVDDGALGLFLRYAYVPSPWTIHPSIRSLRPGQLLRVRDGRLSLETYWSAKALVETAEPFTGTFDDAVEATREALDTAVSLRMIADVPVGAFLSGGIDSSAVVASMRRVAPGRVRTFTISMEEGADDEGPRAARIARHLGVEHTALRFTAAEAMQRIPSLPTMWDEPFGDSSQLATHLVARLARGQVTVALSGDGGDEVFGGYERYRRIPRIAQTIAHIPAMLRPPTARLLDVLGAPLAWLVGDRAYKLAPLLSCSGPWAIYRRLTEIIPDPSALLNERPPERRSTLDDPAWLLSGGAIQRQLMHADLVSYLPDDILVKVDRATMAVGLESREPLLDHRLIALAARFPMSMHIHGGVTKRLLRAILARDLPPDLIDGPKRGFAIPLRAWLRGPLQSWVESLIDERKLRQEGRFQPAAVRGLWAGVRRGEPLEHQLWNVLMFQAWADHWNAR